MREIGAGGAIDSRREELRTNTVEGREEREVGGESTLGSPPPKLQHGSFPVGSSRHQPYMKGVVGMML